MSDLIFSNIDYYKNEHFVNLMRNWNRYIQSDEKDEDVLAEWEEIIMKDFRVAAKEWLFSVDDDAIPNYESSAWRLGCE